MTGLFPDRLPSAVSLKRQVAYASRELFMRQKVYPGLVRKRQMTQAEADEEIACMEAILDTLRGLQQARNRA